MLGALSAAGHDDQAILRHRPLDGLSDRFNVVTSDRNPDTRIILDVQLCLIPSDRAAFIAHAEHVLFINRDVTDP
ncbi:hypothetical protein D3C80_1667090 [compost metagenome]